jgi:hypothetical protein
MYPEQTLAEKMNKTPCLFTVKWAVQTWCIQRIDVHHNGEYYLCHYRMIGAAYTRGGGWMMPENCSSFKTFEGVQEFVAKHMRETPPIVAPPGSLAHKMLQSEGELFALDYFSDNPSTIAKGRACTL